MNIVKNKEKQIINTAPFDENEFYRALCLALDGSLPICEYNVKLSAELLNYHRSFRADYTSVAAILRGTKSGIKVGIVNAMSDEMLEKIKNKTGVEPNSRNRIVKSLKQESSFSVDDFIEAFKKFYSFNGIHGLYTSFNAQKSKELLNYDRAFGNDYCFVVRAFGDKSDSSVIEKFKLDEYAIQKLQECGFFDVMRKNTKFSGEKFASATLKVFGQGGKQGTVDVLKYKDKEVCKNELGYSRSYADDFLMVGKILTAGYTVGLLSGFYSEITSDVEKVVYVVPALKNKLIKKPFNMRAFLNFATLNMDKNLSTICTNQRRGRRKKIDEEYARDYSIDYQLVQNALEGNLVPEFIKQALTPSVKKKLYSIGFGEAISFDLDRYIEACNKFNMISASSEDLKMFDRVTSCEVLDYPRSFARDTAYVSELFSKKGVTSIIMQAYDNDEVKNKLKNVKIPGLDNAEKKIVRVKK